MRKLLTTVGAVSAALALAGPAPAKPLTTVHAHPLGVIAQWPNWPFQGAWIAKADATTIAWGSTRRGAGATTVTDGGAVRTLPARPGCTALTAGGGHVGYDCTVRSGDEHDPSAVLSTVVVSLTGTQVSAVRAPIVLEPLPTPAPAATFGGAFRLDGLGTRWAHYSQNCDGRYCPSHYSQDVDWRTGAARTIKTVDPRLHEDLNAAALTVPLCAPLRFDMAAVIQEPFSVPVVVERPWALLARAPSPADDGRVRWTVWRCGSSRPVGLPVGTTPVAIGGGWALLEPTVAPGPFTLMRLSDRRLVAIGGTGSEVAARAARMQAAITARRAVFAVSDGHYDHIYTARLPRQ